MRAIDSGGVHCPGFAPANDYLLPYGHISLSSARWHSKHTYPSSLGILGKKRNYFPKR